MARKKPVLDTWHKQVAYANYLAQNPSEESDGEPTAAADQQPQAETPKVGPGLAAPSSAVLAALKKKPADRTSAEQELLRVRRRAEEIAVKGGGKIKDSITESLIAEEEAPRIARKETIAATTYSDTKDEFSAARGRGPDGEKLPAGSTAAASAPAQAGSSPAPRGFAMRLMPDGTVRTASGMTAPAPNRSIMQSFGTKEAALAYFGRGPAQPQPMAQAPAMPAAAPAPTPQAASAAPAAPQPVAAPPAAAYNPFTSPTAKLNMANAAAPMTPQAQAVQAGIAKPLPNGGGFDLMPGIELLRQRDAALLKQGTAKRELGVPRISGYQAKAEELVPAL